MKKQIEEIIAKYLVLYPDENARLTKLQEFLNRTPDDKIIDWNNFDGHLVASGFIYALADKKFLTLYHKDLKMNLYPGGHIDSEDKSPLATALREIYEETGLKNIKELNVSTDFNVPIDIDTNEIPYNTRLNLPKHYHYDFTYLFTINKISDIKIDTTELANY